MRNPLFYYPYDGDIGMINMYKRFISFFFITFVFLSQFMSHAQSYDPDFFIYLGFGQSNMQGKGAINSLRDKKKKYFEEQSGARFFKMQIVSDDMSQVGKWAVAMPPIVRPDTGLGPSDYFGRYLVDNLDTCYKVGVVVVAVDGGKIAAFSKDDEISQSYLAYAKNNNETWVTNAAMAYDNKPYETLVKYGKIAQQYGVIKGVYFHQGESDVTNCTDEQGENWLYSVTQVYLNLLEDLGLSVDSVPFIAGEPCPFGDCSSAIRWVDKLPDYMMKVTGKKCAYVASSKGLNNADQYHFDSDGYRELGKRYGEIALPILVSQGAVLNVSCVMDSDNPHSISNIQGFIQKEPVKGLNIIDGKKYLVK